MIIAPATPLRVVIANSHAKNRANQTSALMISPAIASLRFQANATNWNGESQLSAAAG
jgi:hypothetical protein